MLITFSRNIMHFQAVFLPHVSSQSWIRAIVALAVWMRTVMFFNYLIWAPSFAFFQLLILSCLHMGHTLEELFHDVYLFLSVWEVTLKLLTSLEKSLVLKILERSSWELGKKWEAGKLVLFLDLKLLGVARVASSRLAVEGLQCIISITMRLMEFD